MFNPFFQILPSYQLQPKHFSNGLSAAIFNMADNFKKYKYLSFRTILCKTIVLLSFLTPRYRHPLGKLLCTPLTDSYFTQLFLKLNLLEIKTWMTTSIKAKL